jgi:hypothetical protein
MTLSDDIGSGARTIACTLESSLFSGGAAQGASTRDS